MQNSTDFRELLDKEQAAQYLKVSVAWFSSPTRRKVLPDGIRMGKKKYWVKQDLDAFIAKQRQETLQRFNAPPAPLPTIPADPVPKAPIEVRTGTTAPAKKRGRPPKDDALKQKEAELKHLVDELRKLLHDRA